jgi:hypothetical protein
MAAVQAKNDARKAVERKLRSVLKSHVTYNSAVSDEERDNMKLPIHKKTLTRAATPHTIPHVTTELPAPAVVEFHFRDVNSLHKAKPAGVHGVEIAWAILDTPPKSYADLVHSAFDTRSPYTFQFDLVDAGKRFYCCLRWENTRGEKGPWSEIQSAIIP